ncbi:hypothetical protein FZ983_02365 [Azospirillum sp. B21]|uniref:hypothetical protein n=1 Tax=Azospirillum sp. B21 TaxID=2607496 RepID=UPI0011ECAA74|nr:hypothetical protein [Azospirillum sp. B21]KAA0583476.1 hypothetical protein FZ983_02365 [Azospirillum sp. B21]
MIETQALLFLALTGMIGHAVYMAASGWGGFTVIEPEKEETEEETILFTSDRFQQTPQKKPGTEKGEDRPFWLE